MVAITLLTEGFTTMQPFISAQSKAPDSPKKTPPQRMSHGAKTVGRAGRYGGIAVSAWLVTAVATGHGVAAADDSSSAAGSSSGTSTSATTGTSSSAPTQRGGPKRPMTASTRKTRPKSAMSGAPLSGSGATGSATSAEEATDSDPGPTTATGNAITSPETNTVPTEVPTSSEVPVAPATVPASPLVERKGHTTSRRSAVTATSEPSRANSSPVTGGAARHLTAVPNPSAPIEGSTTTGTTTVDASSGLPVTQAIAPVASSTTRTQNLALPAALPTWGPLAIINKLVTGFFNAVLGPFVGSSPTTPSGQSPFAWALLAFVRRGFFNKSPVITSVQIDSQGSTGVITGNIDAVDPDELGKTVKIRSSVYAGAAVPTDCGCAPEPGLIGLSFTNPAILGGAPGDNWHAPAAVDNTCAYLNPGDYSVAFYRGTESGEVTIDGLGTGDIVLRFHGTLLEGGASEQSFATLVPELGTGDLRGVTGTVTSVSSFNPDGSLNGVLTGTVVRPEVRYIVVGTPAHGTVTVDELTGAFTYTPDPEFAAQGGADSFKVVATDKRFNLLNLFTPHNGDPVKTINLNVISTSV